MYKDVYILRLDSIISNITLIQNNRLRSKRTTDLNQILIEYLHHSSIILDAIIKKKMHFNSLKLHFLPSNLHKFIQNSLILGDPYPYIKHSRLSAPNTKIIDSIHKIVTILYHTILNLDKRIEDKIYSGE